MNLYNGLFGTNPFAHLLLKMLVVTAADIPRYRDAFLNENGEIVIYTRTGGGNRAFYENAEACKKNYPEYWDNDDPKGPWNEDLRKIDGYLRDEDDSHDSTYANFIYSVPATCQTIVDELKKLGGVSNPAEMWQKLLKDLNEGAKTPETERALEVGKEIFSQIEEAMK